MKCKTIFPKFSIANTKNVKYFNKGRYRVWHYLSDAKKIPRVFHVFEIDLTNIQKVREKSESPNTYVCYLLKTISEVLSKEQFKHLNGHFSRIPKSKILVNTDVDIALTHENRVNHGLDYVDLIMIRNCESKTLSEIQDFVNNSKNNLVNYSEEPSFLKSLGFHLFGKLVRKLGWLYISIKPNRFRKIWGTTSLTSTGKLGTKFSMPLSVHLVNFALGSVEEKYEFDGIKHNLCYKANLTIGYDHRAIDGAIVARLGQSIKENLTVVNEKSC